VFGVRSPGRSTASPFAIHLPAVLRTALQASYSLFTLCLLLAGCAGTPKVITERRVVKPRPGDGKYVLQLDNALMDGSALTLHLCGRGGRFRQAWAIAPPQTDVAHWADASDLRAGNNGLAGTARARIDNVLYEYDIRMPAIPLESGGPPPHPAGRFKCRQGVTKSTESPGPLGGRMLRRADPSGKLTIPLHIGKAIQGPNDWHRRVLLTLEVTGNKVAAVTAKPDTRRSVRWKAKATAIDIKVTDTSIAGRTTMEFAMGKRTNTYTFAVQAGLAANVACGEVSTYENGKETLWNRCFGIAEAKDAKAPTTGNAVYKLVLTNAAPRGAVVELYVERRNGRPGAAIAVAPAARGYVHRGDASRIKVTADGISGAVATKIIPAGWPGWEAKPTLCEFSMEANTDGRGVLAGTYRVRHVVETREGTLTGQREAWADVEQREALPDGMDWPQWRGPYFNGTGPSSGNRLVDDITSSRLVWRSEEKAPNSWLWSKTSNPDYGGGYSSPVIQDNRLYIAYYVPSGTAADTGQVARLDVPKKWLLDADDVILCMDARTGATLWKSTFPGQAVNYNRHLSGPHMTVCARNGAVYFFGATGNVYALDTVTGQLKWQTDLGPAAARVREVKRKSLETGKLVDKLPHRFCGCPVAAKGIVVCNDSNGGLLGLNAANGKPLWGPVSNAIARTSTPTLWEYEGKTYILAAGKRLVCLELETGKLVWEATKYVANQGSLALAELDGRHYVVCGGLTCFRITPEMPETLWNLEKKYNLHVTSPLVYNGHVYPWRGGPAVCLDLLTGKEKGEIKFWSVRTCSSFVASDDRIVRPHLYNQLLYYKADPSDFRQLGDIWRPSSFAGSTSATIVDGRLFFRGADCVYCHDLRETEDTREAGSGKEQKRRRVANPDESTSCD